jgi:hypothetical protein
MAFESNQETSGVKEKMNKLIMALATIGVFMLPSKESQAQTKDCKRDSITIEQRAELSKKASEVDSLSIILINLAKEKHLAQELKSNGHTMSVYFEKGDKYTSTTQSHFSVVHYRNNYHTTIEDIYLGDTEYRILSSPENLHAVKDTSELSKKEVQTVEMQKYSASAPIPNSTCRAPGTKYISYCKPYDENTMTIYEYTLTDLMNGLVEVSNILKKEIETLEKGK